MKKHTIPGSKSPSIAKQEEFYRTLVETTGTGYVIIDEKGTVLDANREYVHLTGRRELEEIRGRNVLEWTAYYAKEKNAMAVEACMREGYIRNFEIDYADRSGKITHVEINATVVTTGGTKRIYTHCRNITQRKKIEEAVRDSEEMFRKLIENAPDAIVVQTEGKFSYVNTVACRLFGAASADDLLGTPCLERIHPDFRGLIQKRIANINIERKPNPVLDHEIFLRLDGSPVAVEVTDVPIRFHDVNSALVFVRDITEKQKTEEALRNAEKLESIGILAGGIAHDFNNLLVGIFGNLDLARIFISEGNHAEAMATLSASMLVLNRARALTHQLLTFSKGGTPVRKVIHLEPLLRTASKFALSGSSIECVFSISPDLHPCNVDENQISQVIDNIMINAQQAMPAGGAIEIAAHNITIVQGMHSILQEGDYVKISFRDSGIGIPKDIIPRIFDPFFTTKQKGSGLGLAIAYSIMKRHQGAIEVESETGKGTCFHIFLPASADKIKRHDHAVQQEFKGEGLILIMDDERSILTIIAKMVESMGFSTVIATNGDEAIRLVNEGKNAGRPVGIAILDLTIPGSRGGKDIVKQLHKIDPSIKAIVASGFSNDPVMADPTRYGFSGRLNKPFTFEEIKEALRSLADKK